MERPPFTETQVFAVGCLFAFQCAGEQEFWAQLSLEAPSWC
jgi:hypothetical protein